jgi:hypothetical protein
MRTSGTAAIESSETPIATATNALTKVVAFYAQCRLPITESFARLAR